MSKIVVLGAGISGHVAAAHLRRKLSKQHEVVVIKFLNSHKSADNLEWS